MSQMAVLSLIATTLRASRASAAEGAPQALQGDVKAAVMQAFKKAADKGKVWECLACSKSPPIGNVKQHEQLIVHALSKAMAFPYFTAQLYAKSLHGSSTPTQWEAEIVPTRCGVFS